MIGREWLERVGMLAADEWQHQTCRCGLAAREQRLGSEADVLPATVQGETGAKKRLGYDWDRATDD